MDVDDATFVSQMKGKLSAYMDAQYEQERNLMKEVNVINYLIEVLELLRKRSDQPAFELVFAEYVHKKFQSEGPVTPKMKSFATLLFYSYGKQAFKSNDLTYIKRYVYARRSNASIGFYLKLRKIIISNFSYTSRSQMLDGLQIKFAPDDWSTLTTRFLGAQHISTIGSKVKEENAKTRVYDKILTNSIDAVSFVAMCVDIFESNERPAQSSNKKSNQKQQPKKDEEENEGEEHSQANDHQNEEEEENQDEQEEGEEDGHQKLQPSQSVKFHQQQPHPPSQQQSAQFSLHQPKQGQEANLSSPQKKLLSQLQETKYQLLDEKMRQSIVLGKAIKTYEHLADEYVHLTKHSKDQMQFIIYLVNKLKKQSQLTEQDFAKITEFTQYHYISSDLKEALMKTGAYDYAK